MKYKLKYTRFNEHSILIEWPSIIDENTLNDVLNFKNLLLNNYIKVKVDVINTYNSILINYELTIEDIYSEFLYLKTLYFNSEEQSSVKPKIWEVPVCYDEEFGMDLNSFSTENSMSKSEVIPGFLYLGGLKESLYLNRKSIPNLDVKKGAVGIGGNQTGIYPQNSPGGWHIIGNSPINFFKKDNDNPCFAKAGDKIKF